MPRDTLEIYEIKGRLLAKIEEILIRPHYLPINGTGGEKQVTGYNRC
jgi:hypothetical protein